MSKNKIIHPSYLLVSQNETEQMCITFTGTLAPANALALRFAGSSLLELDIRQARRSLKRNANGGRNVSRKVIKKVKHIIRNMHLTSADALPPSEVVMLKSAGKSPLELDIVRLNRKEIQMEEGR